MVLERSGMAVIDEVEGAEAALEAMAAKPYHLVFLELDLPSLGGLAVLERGKRIRPHCHARGGPGGRMKKSIGPKTLILPTPVLLVGTYDASGKPNLATVAWGGIVCSAPVCISVSLRAATYSHGCIHLGKKLVARGPRACARARVT